MFIKNLFIRSLQALKKKFKANTCDINGYRRIYLIHIRKTGGTSINHMFLSSIDKKPHEAYQNLAKKYNHKITLGEKVVVGWNKKLIEKGDYFYAFSHTPYHKLNLPLQTFTIVCFRDPVKRVLSHYNMLMEYSLHNDNHPCMKIEGQWLGNSFEDFLKRIPLNHLLNQLYNFSESYDVNQAIERLKNVNHIFFTEDFNQGIDGLNSKLGLDIKVEHIRKTNFKAEISKASMELLQEKMKMEIEFIRRVKDEIIF